jgi:uncharacterized protein involved in response to NO
MFVEMRQLPAAEAGRRSTMAGQRQGNECRAVTPSEWRPRLRWGTPLPGLLPAGATAAGGQQPFRLVAPFLRLALAISLTAGFGLGAVLALALAGGVPLGPWWPALVQAHGRAQLVGFVGLFILAIGLHFLPRLRGAPLASPVAALVGLLALGSGAVVQAICQPLLAVGLPVAAIDQGGLALGGPLEWVGSSLIMVTLARTLRRGPPLAWRGGLTSILPFLVFGFAVLWLTLLAGAVVSIQLALTHAQAFPPVVDNSLVDGLLFGFALPVSVGMAARLLPIYFGVEVLAPRSLLLMFVTLAAGVLSRIGADITGRTVALGFSNVLLGLFCLAFPLLSGVPVGRRRAIRRTDPPAMVRVFRYPNLLIRSAFTWLLLGGLLFLAAAPASFWGQTLHVPGDVQRHAVTAGYLTLLVLGIGARMIPGFARERLRPAPRLLIVCLAGNLAAVLRVLPPLATALGVTSPALNVAFGLSGISALLAVGIFSSSVWPMLAPRA